jgi:hypothetical protein
VQVEEDVGANALIDESLRATFELAVLARLRADDEDPDVVEGHGEESFGKGLRDVVAVGLGVLLKKMACPCS